MLAVQAAEQSDPADVAMAKQYLAKARPLVQAIPPGSSVAAEFHYRAMQVAEREGVDGERDAHAEWIVDHAPGTPYELNALIQVVRANESMLETIPLDERETKLDVIYRQSRRLAELLGTSGEKIASSKNARVAHGKWAQYAAALGKHDEAADVLERLLEADARNKQYLQRAGMARFNAGEYAASLEHWQTLLAGLPKDSDDWYEAKFYQLSCLQRIDELQFEQASRQFRLLYPEFGPTAWRRKFADLLGN
jgi:tetratricopeptide (TPR) repeat protein